VRQLDCCRNVLRRLRRDHGSGSLVDSQIPRPSHTVEPLVLRLEDFSLEQFLRPASSLCACDCPAHGHLPSLLSLGSGLAARRGQGQFTRMLGH
jgi:hypothetical protein